MSKNIITTLLLSFIFQAQAQENWKLKECIAYGLKNNGNNTIYANQKLAADARAKQVLADYLPRVSLTSSLDNNLKLQQNVIPAGIFGPDEMRVSLTQKFNSNSVAQLDQVIYDQSILTGIKASKYHKMEADVNTQIGQETIIYNIAVAYLQIFIYSQQLEILNYNKNTYESQMQIYALQVSKGVTLEKDLDKVTVDYNNTLSQIRVAQSNIELGENELKFEMGFPISEPLKVNVSGELQDLAGLNDVPGIFSAQQRSDYKLSELNINILQIEQDRIRYGALPKLSGYARYGAVGFGGQFKGAYDDLLPYSAVGLKLSIPFLDFYKRNAQYNEAKLNRMNAEENLKLSQGKYQVEYENSHTKLLRARANVENDQRNVKLAESVFKVTDLQFQKGTTDLTDWLNTQNSLREAQKNYLSSLYSYYQARIDLEKAAGTLKTFYNSL
ncbi:TolC family protein [Flavobacterium sp. FlaQc-48]|uniref:TolC family protein n=1 Tax=Flavobacterium sp. FlaQc-48 TaxID=3374181 RepID=UPI0037568683